MNQSVSQSVSKVSTVPVSVESVIDFDKMSTTQRVDLYAERIKIAYGKHVDAVLDLASTVWEAKRKLNKDEWKLLETKFQWKSDLTKFLAIGKQHHVLLQYKDSLPSARQSLFLIAQQNYKTEQLAKYVESGEINRFSTTRDLNEIINKGKPSSGKKELITLKKVDPSANLVCLIVNTTEEGEKEIRLHPDRVQAALRLIERGIKDLEDLGFEFTENTIKSLEDLKKGANKVAA